jgi:hypothetical protein
MTATETTVASNITEVIDPYVKIVISTLKIIDVYKLILGRGRGGKGVWYKVFIRQ